MNDDKLKKFLKSVDDSRMEKLDIDSLPEPELKSFGDIMPSTVNKKCSKRNLECIDIRRWVALAAAIVLLIIFIPKNNANAGFIKTMITENPGEIEIRVLENKLPPSNEEFNLDFVVRSYTLDEEIISDYGIGKVFINDSGHWYKVERTYLNPNSIEVIKTYGRNLEYIDIANNDIIVVSGSNKPTSVTWFSKHYMYSIYGYLSKDEAINITRNIIELNN